MRLVCVTNLKLAFQDVQELETRVHMRLHVAGLAQRQELGNIRIKLAIGNHVTQALEVIGWVVHATLRQALTLVLLMYAEHGLGLRLKEVI